MGLLATIASSNNPLVITEQVERISKRYLGMSAIYQKAWTIVQEEGHQKFIEDLVPITNIQ